MHRVVNDVYEAANHDNRIRNDVIVPVLPEEVREFNLPFFFVCSRVELTMAIILQEKEQKTTTRKR